MKRLIIAAITGVMALGSSIVTAGPMHEYGVEFKQLMRTVELTREQKQDIRKLIREHREDVALTRTGDRGRDAMWQQQNTFDEEAFRAKLTAQAATMRAQRFQSAILRHNIYQLLTDEQRQKLEQQNIDHRPNHSLKHENRAPTALPRAFSKLSLTDSQAEELITLQTAFKDESSQFRALMKAFRTEEKALIRSDNFNESSWNTLADEYQQEFTNAIVAHAKHKASMMAVLDDTQQQMLLTLRNERNDRHHRIKSHRK